MLALVSFMLFVLVLTIFVALRTFLQWRCLEDGLDTNILLKTAMMSATSSVSFGKPLAAEKDNGEGKLPVAEKDNGEARLAAGGAAEIDTEKDKAAASDRDDAGAEKPSSLEPQEASAEAEPAADSEAAPDK